MCIAADVNTRVSVSVDSYCNLKLNTSINILQSTQLGRRSEIQLLGAACGVKWWIDDSIGHERLTASTCSIGRTNVDSELASPVKLRTAKVRDMQAQANPQTHD